MPMHRRCVFAILAFVATLYLIYKYKKNGKDTPTHEEEEDKEDSDSETITTHYKFNTRIIPLKPPRNDSYSKALSIHYKFNYNHPQYDESDEDNQPYNTLKVVTFNVLATCYALKSSSYQRYCPFAHLQGQYRFKEIGKILKKCDADIIALQEVDQFDKTIHWMKLQNTRQYKVLYHKRTNKKQDGLILAYKQYRYQLYNNLPMRVIKLNDLTLGCASENSQQCFKKDQIGIYVLLQPIHDASHVLFVMNTHLYWHPDATNVRLRQIAYLLNIIHAKCVQIRKDDNINKISLIFCGDFNTLPMQSPHRFMLNGYYTMKAQGNTPLKLMMDSSLNKVARWTRSLGVDVEYFAIQKLDTINATKLFEECVKQDRILITRSKNLAARRECPNHLLLNNHKPKDNLKQIIKYFGIEYDDDAIYTRCTLCNGLFEELKDEREIFDNAQIPEILKMNAERNTFWKCIQCEQVYWFGQKSQNEVDRFKRIFEEAVMEMDKERKETKVDIEKRIRKQKRKQQMRKHQDEYENKEQYDSDIGDLDKKLQLLPNLQRFFWEDVTFTHRFGNRIKSSYQQIYGECPEYTNKTDKFKGCLDYIFYADLIHTTNESIACIECRLMEGDKTHYPNSSWPSDHLLLMSTFELQ